MRSLLFVLLLIEAQFSFGQAEKYWVFFNDKPKASTSEEYVSALAINNRRVLNLPEWQLSDVPVDAEYLDAVEMLGGEVVLTSKWLNAATVMLSTKQVADIEGLGFVREVLTHHEYLHYASSTWVTASPQGQYWDLETDAVSQMGSSVFTEMGHEGSGVIIGVVDGNFWGADQNTSLSDIIADGRLLGTKDFIDPQSDFFDNNPQGDDLHGHYVWQMLAGYDQAEEQQFGFAHGASFYLARTDDKYKEERLEEDRWVAALEWLDSLGVRLVSSSLGYSYGFDDKSENYSPDDMNGGVAVISKAAHMAVAEKGMIVVTSAGNEGKDRRWRVLTAPADVEGVIAVGANGYFGAKEDRSSIGPEGMAYVKPDITAFSMKGTSLAAPMVSGFIACLLQNHPDLTAEEVKRVLQQSAAQYPYANNFTGMGYPRAKRALALLADETVAAAEKVVVAEKSYSLPREGFTGEQVTILHKRDGRWVIKQVDAEWDGDTLKIKRPRKGDSTTVTDGQHALEIIWE